MLLQATVDGMSGMTFTLKDVIYILGLVLPIAGMFVRQKSINSANEKEFERVKDSNAKDMINLNEKLIEAKSKKEAMKAEVVEIIKGNEAISNKRIDAIGKKFDAHVLKSGEEYNKLNSGIVEVKSMLTILIGKK